MDICASVESSLGGHSSATGFLLIFVSRPLSYLAFQAPGWTVCTIVPRCPSLARLRGLDRSSCRLIRYGWPIACTPHLLSNLDYCGELEVPSLLLPSAVTALMNTLPLSGRARIKSTGCVAKAARPFIDDRHTSFTGSCKSIRKRTEIAQITVSGRKGCLCILLSTSQNDRRNAHCHSSAKLRAAITR